MRSVVHKTKKKKLLNILLIPDNEDATAKNFRISYTALNLLLIFLAFLFVTIILGAITYSQVLQAAREKVKLEKDLLNAVSQLRQMERMVAEMDTVRRYREKVTKSFQGYVEMVDAPDEAVVSAKSLMESLPGRTSIFRSVPIATPVTGFVSQEFRLPGHSGIDIVAPVGTPIKSAADGVVLFSGWTAKDGNHIILYHPGGFITHYRHNARNLVNVNQAVQQGEVIAFLGNSGESSSGPHLHFEVWRDGEPVNPRQYVSDITAGE